MTLKELIEQHGFPIEVRVTNWISKTHLVIYNQHSSELYDYGSDGELWKVTTHPVYPEEWNWDNWELYSPVPARGVTPDSSLT